jgi:hypothetical protein
VAPCTKSVAAFNNHELLDLPVDQWSQINGYDVTHALVSSILKVWIWNIISKAYVVCSDFMPTGFHYKKMPSPDEG